MTPEYTLQAACVKLFKLLKPQEEGRLFLNLNNPRSRTNGHFLKGIGLTAGVADMTYLSDKGAIFLEFKAKKGKQSLSQKWWQGVVEAVDYKYVVIRSLEDFQKMLAECS
ncbi:MAG: VRR-NUC domain-containing protein [Betaproteobacteria bacterium]|nr:VRR-NUC domain-containing protein [Betaproteobacteria bacterium]